MLYRGVHPTFVTAQGSCIRKRSVLMADDDQGLVMFASARGETLDYDYSDPSGFLAHGICANTHCTHRCTLLLCH